MSLGGGIIDLALSVGYDSGKIVDKVRVILLEVLDDGSGGGCHNGGLMERRISVSMYNNLVSGTRMVVEQLDPVMW